jgi:DNA-binding phage protein
MRNLSVTLTGEVIVMPRKKTAFDRYIAKRLKDPEFASAYADVRAVIDSTDALIRTLDDARLLIGMSKPDLARQIETRPEIVRRLFTAKDSNPTLSTVLKVVEALGFHLEPGPQPQGSGRERNAPLTPCS